MIRASLGCHREAGACRRPSSTPGYSTDVPRLHAAAGRRAVWQNRHPQPGGGRHTLGARAFMPLLHRPCSRRLRCCSPHPPLCPGPAPAAALRPQHQPSPPLPLLPQLRDIVNNNQYGRQVTVLAEGRRVAAAAINAALFQLCHEFGRKLGLKDSEWFYIKVRSLPAWWPLPPCTRCVRSWGQEGWGLCSVPEGASMCPRRWRR